MKKTILILALLAGNLANQLNAQFTINCDPIQTFDKIIELRSNTNLPPNSNGSGFGFNRGNQNVGNESDTCFIIPDIDTCGIGPNCVLYCCISSGIVSYTILCENYNGDNLPPAQIPRTLTEFTGNLGNYSTYIYHSPDSFEFLTGMEGDSNRHYAGAQVVCNECIESIIGNYLEELFGESDIPDCSNYTCTIDVQPSSSGIFPPTVSVTASTSGCTGTETPLGWTGQSFPLATSPIIPLGGGYGCPANDIVFPPGSVPGTGGTGGAQFCFKSVCVYPYGIRCTTECCVVICQNVSTPLKSAGNKINNNIIELYPVPAKDKINLSVNSTKDDIALIKITSIDGKQLNSNFYTLSKGLNRYEFDLKTYPKGIYYINIQSKDFKENRSFQIE